MRPTAHVCTYVCVHMSVTGLDGDASYIYARRLLTKLLRWGTSPYAYGGTVKKSLVHKLDGEEGGAVLRAWQMGMYVRCVFTCKACVRLHVHEKRNS